MTRATRFVPERVESTGQETESLACSRYGASFWNQTYEKMTQSWPSEAQFKKSRRLASTTICSESGGRPSQFSKEEKHD